MVADVLTRPLLSACEQHFAVSLGCARSPFRLVYLFFFFFFSSPVLLRISTHTLSPPSHAPTPAWPEVEAAAPLQGIDDNHTCTRIACITHLCPPPRFLRMSCGWHATDHPLRPTNRPLPLNCQPMYELTWYVFLPPFFFFAFLSVFFVFSMLHCNLHIFKYYDE